MSDRDFERKRERMEREAIKRREKEEEKQRRRMEKQEEKRARERERAEEKRARERERAEDTIMRFLTKDKKNYIAKCKYCGRALPLAYPYRVCGVCYGRPD